MDAAIKKATNETIRSLFLFSPILGSKSSASKVGLNEGEIGIPLFNKLIFFIFKLMSFK